MENTCFYCDSTIDQHESVHQVAFFRENEELEKTLCGTCYTEWLEGMKE
ncbi:hypothetical protein [Bacillus piscicola]|nr:hypothetical protein [Bacillus piscicola]